MEGIYPSGLHKQNVLISMKGYEMNDPEDGALCSKHPDRSDGHQPEKGVHSPRPPEGHPHLEATHVPVESGQQAMPPHSSQPVPTPLG